MTRVSETSNRARAYGWRDFDQEVVEGLVENDARFVNRRADGWIASPLVGHYDNRLAWKDDNFKKGSVPIGDPPASFRAAPTYVLERPIDNFIAGRELIADAIAGRWGTTEAARLGNENSEGALTWNVFRSLQEAERLSVACRALCRARVGGRAGSVLLGATNHDNGVDRVEQLERLLDDLDPGAAPHVVPDVCLHVPGWGWLVIEASFGPSTDTTDDPERVEGFLERYATACPGLFDEAAVRNARLRDIPPLLLRTIAVAHTLRADGERAVVVALVRKNDTADLERKVGRFLADPAEVGFRRATWESLYQALDPDEPRLSPLRDYLENKSFGLRPAFSLEDDEPAT